MGRKTAPEVAPALTPGLARWRSGIIEVWNNHNPIQWHHKCVLFATVIGAEDTYLWFTNGSLGEHGLETMSQEVES